jgi:hypothetical protein
MNQKTDTGDSSKKPKLLSEKSQVTIKTTLITVVGSVLVAGFTTMGTIYVTKSTVAQAKAGASEAQTSVDELKNQVADATTKQESIAVPVGTIIACGGPISDESALKHKGWLPCDGRPVSRTEYSNLWEVIKDAWGEGDRGTTFNLPDLRGVFLRGVNYGRKDAYADPEAGSRLSLAGENAGNRVGSYQSDNIQTHSHQWGRGKADPADKNMVDLWSWKKNSGDVKALDRLAGNQIPKGSGKDDDFMDVANEPDGFWTKPEPSVGIRGTETRPKNAYVNYIIKY